MGEVRRKRKGKRTREKGEMAEGMGVQKGERMKRRMRRDDG